ncbi:LOW QUALITY PROTEIN: hypothetical protein PanWU01x14_330770 [Parasponia andersonii]|uniref:Uncharacterized protein n=1 Tax=Parasponia andersonii TaxID=3476 RepID=A0A2P5AHY4_PARAD|nr:LOW QUALITY PROTEIN: hypothetical protein PanWU01x14_330770 [Parasponia andersonii]
MRSSICPLDLHSILIGVEVALITIELSTPKGRT